jgi:NADH:ubiquinone oxidoreductase subunit 2 (subunit N)
LRKKRREEKRREEMNFIIVLLNGIILNIFIIKILIYYRRLEKTEKGEEGKEREKNEDSKKKETLKRGTKLLIITVKILKIQILKNKEGKEYSIKDGLILITEGKKILKTYILSISVIIIGNIKNENKIRERGTKKEIKIILKTNIKGIKILILSNDWILTIISWEILNKSLYILVSIKSENESGLAASLKYFVLSALSTT